MKFGLIGDGKIASRHRCAVIDNGGIIYKVHDPKYGKSTLPLNESFFTDLDYVVICSPSYLPREHIKLCLKYNKKIICEKPMILPWEPVIDNDNINVVLQLRWLKMIEHAHMVKVVMVRNNEYFKTWSGDPSKTGGLFYHLFIHYIDLAILLGARFEGMVLSEGQQFRMVDDINLFDIDTNMLYRIMYNDIINHDKGVKPKDLFYLHWWLNKYSNIYGYGTDLLNKEIVIEHQRTMI